MQKTDTRGSRIPFQIKWITADRDAYTRRQRLLKKLNALPPESEERETIKKKIEKINDTSGRILEHTQCVLNGKRGMHATRENIEADKKNIKKNPNHWANRTRNIRILTSNAIRKIHISLILELNHQTVLY